MDVSCHIETVVLLARKNTEASKNRVNTALMRSLPYSSAEQDEDRFFSEAYRLILETGVEKMKIKYPTPQTTFEKRY